MGTDGSRSVRRRRAALDFFGLKRNMLVLLGMVILVGLGEKMAERFLPLYLAALGGGAGGYASDRLGYKRALILFNLTAILGYLIVIIFPTWQAVIVGAVFFLSWTAISLPATMDMVSSVLPRDKRTMGVSMHALVRRVPMALGPLLGGAAIGLFGEKDGVRLAFVVALILGAVSLVLQQVMIEDEGRRVRKAEGNPLRALGLIHPALRNLLVSDILVRFCEQIPYAFVVIWCVNLQGITPLQFGVLTTVEMATAMLIYVPVAYLADRSAKKPFVVATFGFFTLFPLLLLFSRSFWMMVAAFIIRGLKEFGEPTRKALIIDLAPEDNKAGTFGVYYLVRDILVSLAAFGGAFLWDASTASRLFDALGFGQRLLVWIEPLTSPATNFLAAFGFGLLGTLYFALRGKDLGPRQAAVD